MNKNNLNLTFFSQLTYLLLCIVWNVIGLWKVSIGEQAIGPTASIEVIATLLAIIIFLSLARYKEWRILYVVFSIAIFLLAVSSIVGAFSKPPSLWPSDFWRYSGVILNFFGSISFIMLMNQRKYLSSK